MATYQIFVKFLDGRTRCLQIPSPTVSGEDLRRDIVTRTGIPPRSLRVVSGIREISDSTIISASSDGLFPSITLLLRLPGGKGGFGSLLRGAATKAGQKKTNNFDACRDMSGRRLRHVNAEKKLEEWKAEAEDRRLEKLAEDFLKKKAKEVKKNSKVDVEKYLEKYREDTEKCMEKVEESVRQSFELYKESKRKILPLSEPSSKRLKIWLGKKKVDESESESDDGELEDKDDDSENGDQKSEVLDSGNSSNQSELQDGGSPSGSASITNSDEESSGGGSETRNVDEINKGGALNSLVIEQESGSRGSDSASDEILNCVTGTPEEVDAGTDLVSGSMVVTELSVAKSKEENQPESVQKKADLVVVTTTDNSYVDGSLNFDDYDSPDGLELLGMEQLKTLLQKYGLKCGGTLRERAARLFLLKTTPVEKLPKKVLARP
ncbi:replication stress response regulator SDE2-like [Zingiber officinale]|uniref:Sde2 N-terminal ubiquitin domain-containing protein n=1 Tax=Zingiber officinale TaxID=94328 RepID=A0A8J5GUI4_ZINOF|nr:replication stress response regulator SDE2-like [Zingiber officinale]KAG6513057.1 hypothetical protein ZIOFF_023364 [Zingiber officinale]